MTSFGCMARAKIGQLFHKPGIVMVGTELAFSVVFLFHFCCVAEKDGTE